MAAAAISRSFLIPKNPFISSFFFVNRLSLVVSSTHYSSSSYYHMTSRTFSSSSSFTTTTSTASTTFTPRKTLTSYSDSYSFPSSSSYSCLVISTLLHSRSLNKDALFLLLPLNIRFFSSGASKKPKCPKSFSTFSDSSDDEEEKKKKQKEMEMDKSKVLPPPYDPFSKKPIIEDPKDPKDLQEIFHKMRTEGLINNAIKMFDALSKDGLTHEAMKLFSLIKDKGSMPDIVAHTAVIEAYANAGGHSKDALKVYMRMLASGVKPNAYTYTVLIKGLARDGRLGDAKKYMLEMMDRGIRPNVGTYTAVFEALFTRDEEKMDGEARELLEQMKAKGFVADDENAVRDHLSSKRGQVFRSVMNLLFPKC